MKKIVLILLAIVLFTACEVQKPEEEYLAAIEGAKAENNNQLIADSYQKLIKYYPDSPNIEQYRLNYIDLLLENPQDITTIESLVNSIANDTTKSGYLYSVYKLYKEGNDEENAQRILDSFDKDHLSLLGKKLIGDMDYEGSVEIHKTLIAKYPEDPELDKAYFLIGFTYSENMGDKEKAKEYFQTIIDKYPESELADDAEWMVLNMDKEDITFITDEKQAK